MTDLRDRDPGGGTAQTATLLEMLLQPLDPGYAAAALRRTPAARGARARALVAAGCLLIGFTLTVAYVHQNQGAPQAARVRSALVGQVRAAEQNADALETRAQALNSTITALRDSALRGDPIAATLRVQELVAGTTAASGPGVTVVLGDPPVVTGTPSPGARPGSTPVSSAQQFTDRDVRAVVNELWHDGAEAIGVNDVRLTPTSSIRLAGQAVLVDFRPLTSPYTISAIGPADRMLTQFADSATASRDQTLAGARGGRFSVAQATVHLTASPQATLRYARAVTPAPTPEPTR